MPYVAKSRTIENVSMDDENNPNDVAYWKLAKELVAKGSHAQVYAKLCGLTASQFRQFKPEDLVQTYQEYQGNRRFFQ